MRQIAFRVTKMGSIIVQPFAMTASQHYYGQTIWWRVPPPRLPLPGDNEVEKMWGRPVIYIACGTHATYFKPAIFGVSKGDKDVGPVPLWGIAGIGGFHDDTSRDIEINVSPEEVVKLPVQADTWKGFWGEPDYDYRLYIDPSLIRFEQVVYWKGSGPPSPWYRHSGKVGLSMHPKDFHNKFVKENDKDLLIQPVNKSIIDP